MTSVSYRLPAIEQGDPLAVEELLPLVYDELRKPTAARLARTYARAWLRNPMEKE